MLGEPAHDQLEALRLARHDFSVLLDGIIRDAHHRGVPMSDIERLIRAQLAQLEWPSDSPSEPV